MIEIGAFEAKNRLAALLDAVERGEEVTITRRGKPVARLVRHDLTADRAKAAAAAARIRAMTNPSCGGQCHLNSVGSFTVPMMPPACGMDCY